MTNAQRPTAQTARQLADLLLSISRYHFPIMQVGPGLLLDSIADAIIASEGEAA